MKILQLRFKNLNSLQGEWLIDFSSPDFVADGIFAITGPTGSGKSTILDAICLALYGTTPRLGKVSKGTNEIMSRQTGECFSEVVFASQKGVFRCHWSQRRAKGKADGNLQEPQQELSDAATGKVLENKKSLIGPMIEDATGMDFTRFTRSIMLAQGGFAAFLQASGSERAPILEQITGTEIYSEISARVFERQKNENIILDHLQAEISGINLLSSEEEKQINDDLAEKQQIEAGLKTRQKESADALQWLNDIEKLKMDTEELINATTAVENDLNNFAPQLVRLQRAMQAAEVEADYTRVETLQSQQNTDNEQLKKEEILLPQIRKEVAELRVQTEDSDKQLNLLREQLKQQQPLWQQIRAVDIKIAEKKSFAVAAETETLKAEKLLNENLEKLASSQSIAVVAEKDLRELIQWLNDNAGDEILVSQLAAISGHFTGLQKSLADLQKNAGELAGDEKQLKKLDKELKQSEKKLSELSEDLKTAKNNLSEQQNMLAGILGNRRLSEFRTELNFLRKEQSLIRKIIDLDAYRRELEDGRPCPLCGSIEHPLAVGNIPEISENEKQCNALENLIEQAEKLEELIRQLQETEKKQQEKFSEVEKELIQTRSSHANAVKNLNDKRILNETAEENHRQQKTALLDKLQIFGISEISDDNAAKVFDSLNSRLENWQKNCARKAEYEIRLQESKSAVIAAEEHVKLSENLLTEKRQASAVIAAEIARLLSDRNSVFGNLNPDDEEQRLADNISAQEKLCRTTAEKLNSVSAKLIEAETRQANLHSAIANRSEELARLEMVFAEKLASRGFAGIEDFFSCRMTIEERQKLIETEQKLKTAKAETMARLRDRQNKLADEQKRQLTTASVQELEELLASINQQLRTVNEETGAARQRLSDNQKAQQQIKDKKQAIDNQQRECQKWNRLNELIGSKDGARFRNFVQGLTFGIMLNHANQQLKMMTDRYLLVRDNDQPLELKVIDSYQAGEIRSVKNLSGGESFIVSLSLALGLSQMASRKVRVDSLFLDEGFGTLDDESLSTALDTLAGLHQTGKLIGVISHVPALKERIRTQINIKKGSGGRSTITGPGILKS